MVVLTEPVETRPSKHWSALDKNWAQQRWNAYLEGSLIRADRVYKEYRTYSSMVYIWPGMEWAFVADLLSIKWKIISMESSGFLTETNC